MNIKDIKTHLKTAKKDQLVKIILDIYKQLPKKLIEEKGIDLLFTNNPSIIESTAQNMDKKALALIKEIETFVRNFLDGNYYYANRIVTKSKRAKWRFEIMRYLKETDLYYSNTTHKKELADQYINLYKAICVGCNSDCVGVSNPFKSIQRKQEDYFFNVISYMKDHYSGQALYEKLFEMVYDKGISEDEEDYYFDERKQYVDLYLAIFKSFESPMIKDQIIEIAKKNAIDNNALIKEYNIKEKRKYNSKSFIPVESLAMAVVKMLILNAQIPDAITYMKEIKQDQDNLNYNNKLTLFMLNCFDQSEQDTTSYQQVILKDAIADGAKITDWGLSGYKHLLN